MKITLYASWRRSGYGYIIGRVVGKDADGKPLMDDEDMYWNFDRFIAYIKRIFIKTERFKWEPPFVYYKDKRMLKMRGMDLKKEKR